MAEQGGARLAWPDAAKGLGVLLVGLGHSRLLPEWASAWIYSFHMPLFFLLSGWFFSLRPGGVGATLRHKALPILMPYLAYNLAFFCWESAAALAAGGGPDWDGLLGIALQWPDTPWAGRAWFFPGLFAAECLFALLLRALEGRENRLLPAALLAAGAVWIYARLGGARLPWHVDAAVLLLPYLALGRRARHWLERHPASVCSAGQTIRVALVCLGANLLLTAFNRNLGPTRIDYNLRYRGRLRRGVLCPALPGASGGPRPALSGEIQRRLLCRGVAWFQSGPAGCGVPRARLRLGPAGGPPGGAGSDPGAADPAAGSLLPHPAGAQAAAPGARRPSLSGRCARDFQNFLFRRAL